eukprot:gene1246-biopygen13822
MRITGRHRLRLCGCRGSARDPPHAGGRVQWITARRRARLHPPPPFSRIRRAAAPHPSRGGSGAERARGRQVRVRVRRPWRVTAQSRAVMFCCVLFCSVLFCYVLCCAVLFCSVLFCSVLPKGSRRNADTR